MGRGCSLDDEELHTIESGRLADTGATASAQEKNPTAGLPLSWQAAKEGCGSQGCSSNLCNGSGSGNGSAATPQTCRKCRSAAPQVNFQPALPGMSKGFSKCSSCPVSCLPRHTHCDHCWSRCHHGRAMRCVQNACGPSHWGRWAAAGTWCDAAISVLSRQLHEELAVYMQVRYAMRNMGCIRHGDRVLLALSGGTSDRMQ